MREALALTARLALLVQSMRAAGARVGVGDLVAAHRALAAVDPSSRADSYFALRSVLCARHADLEVFDAAFEGVFGPGEALRPPVELPEEARLVLPRVAVPPLPGQEPRGGAPPEGLEPVPAAWSEVELLREKDFAEMSDVERAIARRLVRRIALSGPLKLSRRTPLSRRRGAHPDLRATVRASMRSGGEPIERR